MLVVSSHARRNFFESTKVSKKAASAYEALKMIKQFYTIESKLRDENLSKNEFVVKRKEQILPVIEKFKEWLDKKGYLYHIFKEAPYITEEKDFENLLPWNCRKDDVNKLTLTCD